LLKPDYLLLKDVFIHSKENAAVRTKNQNKVPAS
jgi:hypothetical protein